MADFIATDREVGDLRVSTFLTEVMISATGRITGENVALCFPPEQALAIAEAIVRHARTLRIVAGQCPTCGERALWPPSPTCRACGGAIKDASYTTDVPGVGVSGPADQ
jgi:hypothetical protein